ncbi:MAG: homocysteine S-methyltransferase family protein [Acidobacteriales bacterium]|nr:homocysteine S-methyltransferase family protein [Terriglobales bacterium]
MMSLLEKLLSSGPVVTDGAWGTQLQARGLAPGECPDAWNLTHPDLVEQVARAYVEAGSQVILSNTFGASSLSLARHGLDAKAAEINRAGAAISKRAAAGKALVFASIGPSGKMLMSGEVTEDELHASFAQQAQALKEGGADALVIETMADLTEAKIALAAAKTSGLPVVACVVFDSGKNKDRTMMGNTPEQAATELTEAGADVVGANCGVGIAAYVPICKRLKANTDKPVWIKANAGLPEVVEGRTTWKTTPEEFASYAPALVEAGASFLGGCCGTRPEFIAATLKALGR